MVRNAHETMKDPMIRASMAGEYCASIIMVQIQLQSSRKDEEPLCELCIDEVQLATYKPLSLDMA